MRNVPRRRSVVGLAVNQQNPAREREGERDRLCVCGTSINVCFCLSHTHTFTPLNYRNTLPARSFSSGSATCVFQGTSSASRPRETPCRPTEDQHVSQSKCPWFLRNPRSRKAADDRQAGGQADRGSKEGRRVNVRHQSSNTHDMIRVNRSPRNLKTRKTIAKKRDETSQHPLPRHVPVDNPCRLDLVCSSIHQYIRSPDHWPRGLTFLCDLCSR